MTVTKRKMLFHTVVYATALAALAGCTQQTPGTAGPTTSQPSASSTNGSQEPTDSTNGAAKAPAVKKPLNVAKFVADPCLILTQQQQQEFIPARPGERNDDSISVGCHWQFGENNDISVGIGFIRDQTDGLSRIYAGNADRSYKDGYFEPTEVSGFPAVFSAPVDERKVGTCNINVGVSDQIFFGLLIQGTPGTDACRRATNVAKAAIETIQGGQ